jgi:type III restriction enzyme
MQDPEVLAKRDVAVEWCRPRHPPRRKLWRETRDLFADPHDAIAENMTIEGLAQHYAVDGSS